jgi:quercetin dioxygenase-like cupin family protein
VLHADDVVAQPVPGGALAVLLDSDATRGRLGVIEQTVAARNPGPPLHTHPEFDQLFFVQDGTPEFRVADEGIATAPGSVVFVPCGTPHTFSNLGPLPARLMIVVSPGGFEDYFTAHMAGSVAGRSFTDTELVTLRFEHGSIPASSDLVTSRRPA